jgi:hypothetical protein
MECRFFIARRKDKKEREEDQVTMRSPNLGSGDRRPLC